MLRRRLGVVFQNYRLLTDRNVFDNLHFVMKATGWKHEGDMRKRIDEVLTITGLQNKAYKMPYELSGGQQQRVLLARALCAAKRAILLDEPTAGLDPFVTKEFYELIEKLNREDGLAVIMVSHDIQHVLAAASHVLYVKGNASVYGTVEEFKKGSLKSFLSEGGEVL
jgi:cell division transport system ATP-binding protein